MLRIQRSLRVFQPKPILPLSFLLLLLPSPLCQHWLLVVNKNESTFLIISKAIYTLNFSQQIYNLTLPHCSTRRLCPWRSPSCWYNNLSAFCLLHKKPWNLLASICSPFSSLIISLTSSLVYSFFAVLIFIFWVTDPCRIKITGR